MANPFTAKAKKHKLKPFGKKNPKEEPESFNPFTRRARNEEATGPQTKGYLHPGSEKADFRRNGIAYTNPRDHGEFWTVDVANGDNTYTFHNKHGSWFMQNGRGMVEPQREIAFGLQGRYIAELKRIGSKLPYFLRTEQDKKASTAKDKARAEQAQADKPKKQTPKKQQPAKKAATTGKNPWTARAKKK